jgi:hypothetical protein
LQNCDSLFLGEIYNIIGTYAKVQRIECSKDNEQYEGYVK